MLIYYTLSWCILIMTQCSFGADMPNSCMPTEASENTVLLSAIIAPLKKIRVNQNGIAITPLTCLVSRGEKKYNYLSVDYETKESDDFKITNEPRKYIWALDPQKRNRLPQLEHLPTHTFVSCNATFDTPTEGSFSYAIEAFNAASKSMLIVNVIILPNHVTHRECSIGCEKAINPNRLINNQLFSSIQTLSLQAQRLVGDYPFFTLCTQLPHLTHLSVSNTELDDTLLSLAHKKLLNCEIVSCGITDIGLMYVPTLRFLTLTDNNLTQFDTHALGKQPCNIDLTNNHISSVYSSSKSRPFSQAYIDISNNPIDKQEMYKALFKKSLPESIPHDLNRTRAAIGLKHNNFMIYKNGDVEDIQG